MEVLFGKESDIYSWMELVKQVSWNFTGLETDDRLEEHKMTVLKFISKRQALCVKDNTDVIGILLFSRNKNMICCLAVSPDYRNQGIASTLLRMALSELDKNKDITVSTFREDDDKGIAPRALYKSFGFEEGELTVEFGYPNQIFVLRAQEKL